MTAIRSDCPAFRPELAELALGLLDGRDRAEAVAHVEGCPACAAELESLSAAGDLLLSLAPEVEPPAGFELAALRRLAPDPAAAEPTGRRPAPRWSATRWSGRRWMLAAAAAVVVLALGLGWGLSRSGAGPTPAPVTAALVGPAGSVGSVTVVGGSPGWLVMDASGSNWSGQVSCQVTLADGSTRRLGTFSMAPGYGTWTVPLPVPLDQVRQARLVAADGTVVASASLTD